MASRSRSREPLPVDLDVPPVVADMPTFETRADTDIFHILNDERPRSLSPQSSTRAARVPWYKTPSPIWLLPGVLLAAILMGATIAPRTELYIKLACNEIHPEYLLVPPPPLALIDIGEPLPPTPDTPIYVPPPASPGKPSISIPGPNKMCSTDPKVLGAVAKLSTAMTTSMGILSCLTTGAWSQLSDRVGRARVLSLAALGVLFTDLVLILVAFYADALPGGYRFLIVGSVIDGALGGWTTASAISHAYVSDTVDPNARSRIFSFFIGSMFVGMAAGPTLGALLIRHTNDLLSIFYIGAALHAINAILCTLVLPESLTEKERLAAKERYSASQPEHLGLLSRLWGMVTTFSRPLVIFLPKGRNWNLTLIGVAYGSAMLNMGSYAFKFQYAIATFEWGTTELGYWMSIVGITRSVHLVVLLPLFIKLLHVVYDRIGGRTSSQLDLLVARLSLVAEVLGYILCAVIVDPLTFVLATCWLALGGGFSPSVQSLALALCQDQEKDAAKPSNNADYGSTMGDRDQDRASSPATPASQTGRLFGALSVLQSLTSQIIGPSMFGAVFVNTIGVAPRAIFWTSAGCIGVSLLALSMVRLKAGTEGAREEEGDEESRLLG
ncbi:major facilitator superfamily transporter [Ceratobasidium sp. AG-Ba]|nr:major facilitator superfamily transporter [Ceratobasidium sp. AG-Ba]